MRGWDESSKVSAGVTGSLPSAGAIGAILILEYGYA